MPVAREQKLLELQREWIVLLSGLLGSPVQGRARDCSAGPCGSCAAAYKFKLFQVVAAPELHFVGQSAWF